MKKPNKKAIVISIAIAAAAAALIAGIVLTNGMGGTDESINEVMRDAVLHENDRINVGFMSVNPAMISGWTVTACLVIFAVVFRLFIFPRFKLVPGKFQTVVETAVEYFDGLATNANHRHSGFLGAYIFAAGAYIFFGTLLELVGIPVQTVSGSTVCLPAPLSDINAAVSLGCLSYLVILFGGLILNGVKGFLTALKDFSLPISMSFRMFGALLSGALVTELIYYYMALSFVLPVLVGVLFTLLHALIQAYVLTMLTAMFFGESTERNEKIKERAYADETGAASPETA